MAFCINDLIVNLVIIQISHKKKPGANSTWLFKSGERGIRTPGGVTLNGFQDRRIRPLCHFSNGCKYTALFVLTKPIQPLIQHDNLICSVLSK